MTPALALALTGCRVPPPDLSAAPAELLAMVRTRQEGLRRVSGSAWLRLDGKEAKGAVRALIVAEKPDGLRVELLDFFGNPALSLAAARGHFVLHDSASSRWIRGPATGPSLGRLLPGIPPLEELVDALCGSAPLLADVPAGAAPGDEGRELLLVAGELEQRIEVGAQAAVMSSRTALRGVAGNQTPAGRALRFGRFRMLGGKWFPGEIEMSGAGARLLLRWEDELILNFPGPSPSFELLPPAGVTVEDWGAGPGRPLSLPAGGSE